MTATQSAFKGKGLGLEIAGAILLLLILAGGLVWCLYFCGGWPEPDDGGPLPEEKPKLSLPALALVLYLVTSSLYSSELVPQEIQIGRLQNQAVQGLAVAGVLFLCLQVAPGVSLQSYGFRLRRWHRQLAVGGLGFLASFLPVYLLLQATSALRSPETLHPFLQFLKSQPGALSIAWIALSVVVVAPLLEELIYRIVLQSAFARFLPTAAAIPLTAVVFCLVHGWPDMIPLLPLALILGLIYHRYRSYLAIVTTHALFNACMLGWALLVPSSLDEPSPPPAVSGTTPNGLLPSVSESLGRVFTFSKWELPNHETHERHERRKPHWPEFKIETLEPSSSLMNLKTISFDEREFAKMNVPPLRFFRVLRVFRG